MKDIILIKTCCTKVACFSVPIKCPKCGRICENNLNGPPVILDNPFVENYPKMSILIKPSGDGHTWASTGDLHVGISHYQKNTVTSYDINGVIEEHFERWKGSVVIYTASVKHQQLLSKVWELTINSIANSLHWTVLHYDEEMHNCLDFVVEFLKQFSFTVKEQYPISPQDLVILNETDTRQHFVEMHLLQKFNSALDYNNIQNHLLINDYFLL